MYSTVTNENYFQENDSMEFESLEQDWIIPQFHCLGKINHSEDSLHEKGYVCSGEFKALLDGQDPLPFSFQSVKVEIFGKCYLYEEAFFNDTELLLKFAKQAYLMLEWGTKSNLVSINGSSPSILRQNLNKYLAYLRVFTYRFLINYNRDEELELFGNALNKVVSDLSCWPSPLGEMPEIVFREGSLANSSATANLFHTYFDLRWTLFAIPFMAVNTRKNNEGGRPFREMFAGVLHHLEESLFEDLIHLAIKKFIQISPSDWSHSSPFNCTCIREVWLMLQMIKTSETTNFCQIVWKVFQNMVDASSKKDQSQDFFQARRCKMPSRDLLAVVWLLTHLSKLGGFDANGFWDGHFSRVKEGYEIVNKIVNMYLSGSDCNEDRTRGLMSVLYSLCQTWRSNLNLCISLWEYFSRRFDEQFSTPSAFESLPYTSSLSWYDHLTTTVEPWKVLTSRYNSYFIFLRLLGSHLEMMNPKNQASLKARLYVKLHGKKILELSPVGLYHIISACLTVALTSDPSDMCVKIQEMAQSEKRNTRNIFFVAEMVLLLSCVHRSFECQTIAESIACHLEMIARCFNDTDLQVREEQRQLANIFIEGFQEIMLHSRSLNQGQIKLIGPAFKMYLKNCGSCDRSSVLDALAVFMKNSRKNTVVSEEVFNAVLNNIYPAMKEKFAQEEYVTFFFELTLCSLENHSEFQTLFSYLCLDDKINPRLTVRYLSMLLSCQHFMPSLSLQLDNYEAILIQSWFRVSFLLPRSSELKEDLEILNNVVRRLPRMAEMMLRSKIKTSRDDFLLDFLQMISAIHQSLQNFNDRLAARETFLQYIGPLEKHLVFVGSATSWESAEQTSHILRLGGELYFHCGNIIFTKGKADCLLVQLNNVLLIPGGFFDINKELPASVSAAMQKYLPMYIFGLFRLNPAREPYLSRCLNSVFQVYLTRYPENISHPFTRCWTGMENEPVTESLVPHIRNWFLQVITTNVLPQKTAKTSPYLSSTLRWLKYLCMKQEWKLEILSAVLLPLLELALMLEEVNGKRSVTDMLKTAICDGDTQQQSRVSERCLRDLIVRHLAFNSNRMFKLVEVISVLNADLVRRILPFLRDHVAITEAKRGTGIDSTLRQHIEKLEMTLGLVG